MLVNEWFYSWVQCQHDIPLPTLTSDRVLQFICFISESEVSNLLTTKGESSNYILYRGDQLEEKLNGLFLKQNQRNKRAK